MKTFGKIFRVTHCQSQVIKTPFPSLMFFSALLNRFIISGDDEIYSVSLSIKMRNTGLLIWKTFGEIKDIHICFSIN
jgi:hypothetical protein